MSQRTDAWWLIWKLQRGDVAWVSKIFSQKPYDDLPEWMIPVQKAFFLYEKWDIIWSEQLLSNVSHDDASVRGLYLWLRAYFFCVQKKTAECLVLATDANTLDPLSPLWLNMLAIALSANRDRWTAEKTFLRAEQLAAECLDQVCLYHRGVMRFYRGNNFTGSREDLAQVLEIPQYAYDATLFTARWYYNQRLRDEAKQWFLKAEQIKLQDGITKIDRVAQMRLARISREQWRNEEAMQTYQWVYATQQYDFEMITDMIVLANKMSEYELEKSLIEKAKTLLGTNTRAHLQMSLVLRTVGRLDEIEIILSQGEAFASSIEDVELKNKVMNDFSIERGHLLIAMWFKALRANQSWKEFISLLELTAIDPKQILFMQWMESVLLNNLSGSNEWLFIQIPELNNESTRFLIETRWRLFLDNTVQGLRIFLSNDMLIPSEQTQLTKRALATRAWDTQLAKQIESEAITNYWLPIEFSEWDSKLQRNYVFWRFRPWMNWMMPYFTVDYFWDEKQFVE